MATIKNLVEAMINDYINEAKIQTLKGFQKDFEIKPENKYQTGSFLLRMKITDKISINGSGKIFINNIPSSYGIDFYKGKYTISHEVYGRNYGEGTTIKDTIKNADILNV